MKHCTSNATGSCYLLNARIVLTKNVSAAVVQRAAFSFITSAEFNECTKSNRKGKKDNKTEVNALQYDFSLMYIMICACACFSGRLRGSIQCQHDEMFQ